MAVTKVSPRPSMTADAETVSMVQQVQQQQQSQLHQQQHHSQSNQSNQVISSNISQQKPEPGKAPSRAGDKCRVCLKSFKPDDFSKICAECQQKVCEDCASYSKLNESEDAVSLNHNLYINVNFLELKYDAARQAE